MGDEGFPGTLPPQRRASVPSLGLRLNVVEWGDAQAQPLLLCHGMWDHARSFATLAPVLARHFRVVALDARGHGDSDWADAYAWPVGILDVINVLQWLGRPACLIGHSMGGGQATDAACAAPELVRKLVNIDGFGGPPLDDDAAHLAMRFSRFLDFRRKFTRRPTWRPYANPEALVERRLTQNPRLPREWMRYFVRHGSRTTEGGWVWKSDPQMAEDMGPWRPEWIGPSWAALQVPMLAIRGSEPDTWGPLPESLLRERLRHVRHLERATINGAGHFVHIERPTETARVILDYLGS
jgi:pimeloyl-ACP methyl ester carboxylesterase